MIEAPPTATKRGRKPGAITEIGKLFANWPFNEWVEYRAASTGDVPRMSRSVRNLAYRKGITVSVRTDREDDCKIHVLKIKETTDGTQE
jgi:hypothetical protein